MIHWIESQLACVNWATGRRVPVSHDVVGVLNLMDDWTTRADLLRVAPELGSTREVDRLLRTMVRLGLAETKGQAQQHPWHDWAPEAAFFHFGTRDSQYPSDPLDNDRRLRRKARSEPQPAPIKTMTGPRIALPAPATLGDLSAVLRDRRTWRNFGPDPISLSHLATLLQHTWGVQKWGTVRGQGDVVLKTSPSAGARHPLEVYVLALNVTGLAKRAYHYDAAKHHLTDLGKRVSSSAVERLLAGQYYFKDAAVVLVMSAVFERSMWRYSTNRAYRTVLIDAGHLGQTFCLSATALGLAPFCTMAFHDSALERLIGVDGVRESAMYVVGAGSRPSIQTKRPGRMSARREPMEYQISIDLYSGIPNPTWTIRAFNNGSWRTRFDSLDPAVLANDYRLRRSGFKGMTIVTKDGDGTRSYVAVDGFVFERGTGVVKLDPGGRTAELLFETAPPEVLLEYGLTYDLVTAPAEAPSPIAGIGGSGPVGGLACADAPAYPGNAGVWKGGPSAPPNPNNCYSYANNHPITFDQYGVPGPNAKCIPSTQAEMLERLASDQLDVASPVDMLPAACPIARASKQAHYIAVCFRKQVGSKQDFHCLRLDATGVWSHKDGTGPVTSEDAMGNTITDLRVARFDGKMTLIGFLASIEGKRQID